MNDPKLHFVSCSQIGIFNDQTFKGLYNRNKQNLEQSIDFNSGNH